MGDRETTSGRKFQTLDLRPAQIYQSVRTWCDMGQSPVRDLGFMRFQ